MRRGFDVRIVPARWVAVLRGVVALNLALDLAGPCPLTHADVMVDETAGTINLILGKAHVLDFSETVTRASITDPKVAAVVVLSPKSLLISGKSTGVTNLMVWDDKDQKQVFDVDVRADTSRLQELIRQVAPGDPIEVQAAQNHIIITGQATRPNTVKAIEQIAAAFSAKDKVVNLVRVAEPAQIMLKVRFVEINRSGLQNIGLDLVSEGSRFFLTTQAGKTGVEFGQDKPFTEAPNTFKSPSAVSQLDNLLFPNATEFFGRAIFTNNGRRVFDIAPHLQLLEKKELLRVLAEPNLLAKSGEEATFLAGGELPIPLVTGNTITVQWKEFGVRLKFLPQVTESGSISLKVEPEVSSLDFSNAIKIAGFEIPAVRSRKAQTTVELKDSESLAIGGLLSQETSKTTQKIPMASELPVLGDLFKSDKFKKGETELLVIVTPSLVRPNRSIPTKPLQTDQDLAPFVKAGRAPFPDAQGARFRKSLDHKRDAIWEPELEADPFLRRKQPDDNEPDSVASAYTGPEGADLNGDGEPDGGYPTGFEGESAAPARELGSGPYDSEYHETLEKYRMATEDPSYTMIPGMIKERLWGRSGVADGTTDADLTLWDQLGYRNPSTW